MTYKIISTRQVDATLFTTVEYNFDGNIVTIEIAHFMPNNTEEINANIVARAESELVKINAVLNISSLIPNIIIGEEKSL